MAQSLEALVLRAAFRHHIREPDFAAGYARFCEMSGVAVSQAEFRNAVARALAAGRIHDPVCLPDGALQCHWRLEVTPMGVDALRALAEK